VVDHRRRAGREEKLVLPVVWHKVRNLVDFRVTATYNMLDTEKIVQDLRDGKVIVLPTDTIYGISCLAFDADARARIAQIKDRNDEKKFVVLIGNTRQLFELGIFPNPVEQKLIKKYWPGSLTIAFTLELAVRFPDYPELCEMIQKTGPIVSTSANISGQNPARSIDEAKKMFGDQVDAYYNDGIRNDIPSTLVRTEGVKVKIIRQGAVHIDADFM